MTGSASKGNGGKYFYYHCQPGCKQRFKAQEANEIFIKELRKIRVHSEILEAYYEALKDKFRQNEKDNVKTLQKMNEEIKKHQDRINQAQQLMLDGELDLAEYKLVKKRYEGMVNELSKEKVNLESVDSNYIEYLSKGVEVLKSIDKSYQAADLAIKQKIIGSIFPEKLIFENNKYRTNRINSVVGLITQRNNKLLGHKKGLKENLFFQSSRVGPAGIEPATHRL
jgi:site-specific DNA recombinase